MDGIEWDGWDTEWDEMERMRWVEWTNELSSHLDTFKQLGFLERETEMNITHRSSCQRQSLFHPGNNTVNGRDFLTLDHWLRDGLLDPKLLTFDHRSPLHTLSPTDGLLNPRPLPLCVPEKWAYLHLDALLLSFAVISYDVSYCIVQQLYCMVQCIALHCIAWVLYDIVLYFVASYRIVFHWPE